MKKNLWLLGVLVFIFASCNPATEPGSGPKDIWSDITSLDQVGGTWAGTQTRTMPLKDILEALGLLKNADPLLEAVIKDVNVDIAARTTVIIDSGEETMSGTVNMAAAFSGGNTDMLWIIMKEYVSQEMLPPGASIDDESRSITMDYDQPPTDVTLEDLAPLQINQNGTKLKMVIDSDTSEFGQWGSLMPSEIILEKQ